jgi:hypothetical protein
MIKSLSSYYLTIPFVSPLTGVVCTSYKINLYIWSGLKADVHATPIYVISKNNIASSLGNDKINIARLLNDYIDFFPTTAPTTSLISSNNQKWYKSEVIYTTTDPLDLDVPQLGSVDLVLKGYGYGNEGENAQTPSNNILIPIADYKVNRGAIFTIPIKLNEV